MATPWRFKSFELSAQSNWLKQHENSSKLRCFFKNFYRTFRRRTTFLDRENRLRETLWPTNIVDERRRLEISPELKSKASKKKKLKRSNSGRPDDRKRKAKRDEEKKNENFIVFQIEKVFVQSHYDLSDRRRIRETDFLIIWIHFALVSFAFERFVLVVMRLLFATENKRKHRNDRVFFHRFVLLEN